VGAGQRPGWGSKGAKPPEAPAILAFQMT